MFRFLRHLLLLTASLTLVGCLYDYAPSGPVRNIDTSLLGQWITHDKSGHEFTTLVTRSDVDHYNIEFQKKGTEAQEFSGWISRVDGFSILVLRSLNDGPTFGKFAIYHYELLTKSKPTAPGDIGANRIRLSELELDESTRSLDSYHLRAAIRNALKAGTLLLPHNVVADLKENKEAIPGSVIWTQTGHVTFHGETF
jgi:hypothetical protein